MPPGHILRHRQTEARLCKRATADKSVPAFQGHALIENRNGLVKMHLPVAVATKPDSGDVCIAGHCASATGCGLIGVVNDGSDVRAKEANMRINEGHRG